ncbi:AMP nucleosidase [Escherichia coli]|nr:AMP nucleosidase [Escherichia coli]EGO9543775.1 AMP nucleosidase [Escherichia coli]
MLPSETMIWQPEFTDKTLSRKTGAVHSTFVSYPMTRNALFTVFSLMGLCES